MRIKPKTTGQKIADLMNKEIRNTTIKPLIRKALCEDVLSIENVMKICREDEQNQLAEMLRLQEEANFNNEQFNKGDMK